MLIEGCLYMSVIHNEAKKEEISKRVLMCGDPLRAKFIADNYLKDAKLVNKVRNMFCYTGKYKDKLISVMGSGMGVASMGIYSYELFSYYDVDTIIRVGTCGAYKQDLKLGSIILVNGASSDSNYFSQFSINANYSATSNFYTLRNAYQIAQKNKLDFEVGDVLTSDFFYHEDKDYHLKWSKLNILAVEMESYALFINAKRLNKKALSILTVSDNLLTGEKTTSAEREKSFNEMMILSLETIIED